MKPRELGGEVRPGRIDVFPGREIGKVPHVGGAVVTPGYRGASGRETRMREDKNRDTAGLQNAMKCLQGSCRSGVSMST